MSTFQLTEVKYNSQPIKSIWSDICKRMISIVWHYDDVIIPFQSNREYYSYIKNMCKIVDIDLSYVLTVTNFIDSLVGEVIDEGLQKLTHYVSQEYYYEDIKLYLYLQSASEIVHQKVYKNQFEMIVKHDEQDWYKGNVLQLLSPISELCKNASNIKLLTICVTIETVLIPLIFNMINEFKAIFTMSSNLSNEVSSEAVNRVSNELAEKIISTVCSANRLILRDELTHVKGGCEFIYSLKRYISLADDEVDHIINVIFAISMKLIEHVSSTTEMRQRYIAICNILITILRKLLVHENVDFNDYPELSMIKATLPSVDGFFYGTVTSYLNGNNEYIRNPQLF